METRASPPFLGHTTGDGLPDVVGFGDTAVIIATGKGDGTFNAETADINDFAYSTGGWRVEKHPRTVADLTGDGKVDVVGFGDAVPSRLPSSSSPTLGSIRDGKSKETHDSW